MVELVELVEALGNSNLDKDRLTALVKDPDTVIMSHVPPSSSLLLLHHVTKLGGTRLNKEVSYVGLSGFGNLASPILITKQCFPFGQDQHFYANFLPSTDVDHSIPDV
jgi:hypothetical protein